MDSVKIFHSELFSLYDQKIPISKAKMILITRNAMKAIKFYKHVVQSVEKFIQKCKIEYKIPGLYVIDSIVRQSRHQFGPEKDVFAPRFARNMEQTFVHLYRCPPEEKSKLIRVLNLWQKNNVFAPEVIQPLFDLANPDHPLHQTINTTADASNVSNGLNASGISQESPPQNQGDDNPNDIFGSVSMNDLQQYRQHLLRQTQQVQGDMGNSNKDSVKFNKKLLDFDYGSDEDDDKQNSPHLQNQAMQQQNLAADSASIFQNNNIAQILSDPNVLKQLQTLQKFKQHEMEEKQTIMRIQEEAFEKHLSSVLTKLPFASECEIAHMPSNDMGGSASGFPSALTRANINTFMQQQQSMGDPDVELLDRDHRENDVVINLDANSRSPSPARYKRRKSRSRSPRDSRRDRERDRDGRRRRSRTKSRSRSRSPRSRRRNSSRDRTKDKERDKEREIEKERRRRGLPEIKKDHLSVCSTTLWVGHLSKLVQQEDLSDTFGKFGDIVSIDMIHPRGCAFIVMNRRQDAYKAMQSLKNHKLQGRVITISWAAGKGVKSKEWKDYWDLELGVSYIPVHKLNLTTDFQSLEEGGMFDEDTVPAWVKDKLKQGEMGTATAMVATTIDGKAVNPAAVLPGIFGIPDVTSVDTSQPPPSAAPTMTVPPFSLTGLPRLMTPMGLSLAGLPGLSMPGIGVPPPGLVPGMIPGMVAGMPPMTAPPPIDKSIPPPSLSALGPPFNVQPPSASNNATSSDDQMDIEMDEDHKETTNLTGSNFFSHPPPILNLGILGMGVMQTNVPPPSLPTSNSGTTSSASGMQGNAQENNDNNDYNNRRGDRSGNDRSQSRERDRRDRSDRNDRRDYRDRDRSDRRDRSERNDRRDYRDRNDRDREGDRSDRPRWGNRDKETDFRDRRGGDRNDRNDRNRSKDRNENKNVQDRLRDMAGDGFVGGNNRSDRFGGPPNSDYPNEFGSGQQDFNMRDNRDDRSGPMRGGFGPPGRFPGRGGRMMPPFNQRGGPPAFGRGGGRGFHNNFNDRGGGGPGFYDRGERGDFEDGGPRGRMRGGMMDRRGGHMGQRPNWNRSSIPSLMEEEGDRNSRMPNPNSNNSNPPSSGSNSNSFNRFDKNKRNTNSRWTGADDSLSRDERLQEQNENDNWDQEEGGGGNDDDFSSANKASKNDIEDNGPPGFENDFDQSQKESRASPVNDHNDSKQQFNESSEPPPAQQEQKQQQEHQEQQEDFNSEPEPKPQRQQHNEPPKEISEPQPQQEQQDTSAGGNTTPLCDEPENKD